MKTHLINCLELLARRFNGVDLQARPPEPAAWPKRWRARIVTTKNERAAYRLTAWGDTVEEVAAALQTQVDQLDNRPQEA